jgi:hypothetical protein
MSNKKISELSEIVSLSANDVLPIVDSSEPSAETKKVTVDLLTGHLLPRAGGVMTGPIDMGGNKVLDVGAPTLSGDAANKAYVDDTILENTSTLIDLESNHANSSATRTDIPGFSFPVVAGNKYKISLFGRFTTADTGNGASLGVVLADSGAGEIQALATMTITNGSASSATHQCITAVNSSASTAASFITSPSANNASQVVLFSGIFKCTTSGTFKFQWGSEDGTNASTILAGAVLEYAVNGEISAGSILPSQISLSEAAFLIGNTDGEAEEKYISGDGYIDEEGVLTLENSSITGQTLSGFSSAPGTVTSSDSILESIEKLDGNTLLTNVLTVQGQLTQAQILDLHNTPVEAIAAPGSGYYIEPVSVQVLHGYSVAPYTGSGLLEFKIGTTLNVATFDNDVFTATSNTNRVLMFEGSATDELNSLGLNITASSQISGGASGNKIYYSIMYRIRTLLTVPD